MGSTGSTEWITLNTQKAEDLQGICYKLLEDYDDELSTKEQEFIDGLIHNVPKYRRISERQWEWLERIYKKVQGMDIPIDPYEKSKKGDDIEF